MQGMIVMRRCLFRLLTQGKSRQQVPHRLQDLICTLHHSLLYATNLHVWA